ncbi:UDP-N-acetylmuramoyl-tripeptide--D-alanyl-D-alanine ligase [Galactobacter sp.]|uniref:UDP-N-acetylmuramoyl-tripeptide--D-alanyl-D- alanine ligase n=1 Tax=Galactobacter sp. TaxID=2676125 RepID=UPI0025B888C4|nr:UDP-N-acetylmuramoyl-tripeptide--D-alanyl-D-alanine ligase [Galactobacter sp.]
MITLTTAEIAAITHGRLSSSADPDSTIHSVTTDSREVRRGALFVAKPGEVTDGHVFIPQALEAGAALVLAQRDTEAADGSVAPAVIVEDVVLALKDLATEVVARVRAHGGLKVVGVTGSAGKTTTKDLLASVLATRGETVKPFNSYNGEVGLPLTVFETTESTEYLVAEMGATHVGNIAYLADIVKPDVGVVLMVGTAHVGEFGGVDNIAATKGELVESLPEDGVAVLNVDDARVWAMRERTSATVLGFGEAEHAQVRAVDVTLDDAGHPEFTLRVDGQGDFPLRSGLIGRHHLHNVLAAAAACIALGVPAAEVAAALDGQGPGSRFRMERTERPDGVSIINDAYNANPESMLAALQTLAVLGRPDREGRVRRTWAVIGEMRELGEDRVSEHDRLGRLVVRMNISKTLVIGSGAKPTYNAAVMEGSWGDEAAFVETTDEAYDYLDSRLEPGDIVLFKSSNASGLAALGQRVAGAGSQEG